MVEEPQDGQLHLVYLPLSVTSLWGENPKTGDVELLVKLIWAHGFNDPPLYATELDAWAHGNTRVKALLYGRDSLKLDPPKHVIVDPNTGDWLHPALIGSGFASEMAAQAYAIDHNNSQLIGADGGFTAVDALRLWDAPRYLEMLGELVGREMTATVDEKDFALMMRLINKDQEESAAPPLLVEEAASPGASTLPKAETVVLRFNESADRNELLEWLREAEEAAPDLENGSALIALLEDRYG